MTTEQKLKALFQHAKKQGWKGEVPTYDKNTGHWYVSDGDGGYFVPSILEVLLDHEFARTSFGEHTETMTVQNNTLNVKQIIDMDGWRYHLQQAVLLPSIKEMVDYYHKIVFGEIKPLDIPPLPDGFEDMPLTEEDGPTYKEMKQAIKDQSGVPDTFKGTTRDVI